CAVVLDEQAELFGTPVPARGANLLGLLLAERGGGDAAGIFSGEVRAAVVADDCRAGGHGGRAEDHAGERAHDLAADGADRHAGRGLDGGDVGDSVRAGLPADDAFRALPAAAPPDLLWQHDGGRGGDLPVAGAGGTDHRGDLVRGAAGGAVLAGALAGVP